MRSPLKPEQYSEHSPGNPVIRLNKGSNEERISIRMTKAAEGKRVFLSIGIFRREIGEVEVVRLAAEAGECTSRSGQPLWFRCPIRPASCARSREDRA